MSLVSKLSPWPCLIFLPFLSLAPFTNLDFSNLLGFAFPTVSDPGAGFSHCLTSPPHPSGLAVVVSVINKCESARLQLLIGLVPQLWAQLWPNQQRQTLPLSSKPPTNAKSQKFSSSWQQAIFPTFTPILWQSCAKLGDHWIGMVPSPNFLLHRGFGEIYCHFQHLIAKLFVFAIICVLDAKYFLQVIWILHLW